MHTFFVSVAPGLEEIAAEELRHLGHRPSLPSEGGGGLLFEGELEDLYRANLNLRTASRVLLRLGDFYAAAFSELRKKAGRLAWERYLLPGQPLQLHVTCHKSRLYHSDAVAERIAGAIGDRLGKPSPIQKPGAGEEDHPSQLVVARLVKDHCTISLDSSGALLHQRGYRLATAKAPLRETLAAAMLLAAGWDAQSPLLDPFCGSGTIPIEAALLGLGLPPGRERSFAFMNWPGYDPPRWQAVLTASMPPPGRLTPPIQASDRDAGAIRLARANAGRAGVATAIEFSQRAISAIEPPAGPGWIVTNPPYGLRLSPNQDLRDLYAQFGHTLRRCCLGWRLAILCSDFRLLAQTGLQLDSSFATVNGGVNVRLARGTVPAA
jgi:putative N6-adenine-specific DNA methylase